MVSYKNFSIFQNKTTKSTENQSNKKFFNNIKKCFFKKINKFIFLIATENLLKPFSFDFLKVEKKSISIKTQSLSQIGGTSNKVANLQGNLTCRLCLNEVEHEFFQEHSKICKKLMEKNYLMNVLKKNGINYFSNLNTIERKLSQSIVLER